MILKDMERTADKLLCFGGGTADRECLPEQVVAHASNACHMQGRQLRRDEDKDSRTPKTSNSDPRPPPLKIY